MHRPSGIAVITAGLGALVIVHGVLSWGVKRAEPWPQQALPASSDIGIGTTFHLHSGAWRAWPAPVEEAPATTPVALPAAEAPPPPVRSAPSQQITRHVEPPTPPSQAQASGQLEPPAPSVDKAPAVRTPPSAEGRMALAGPDAEAAHPPAGHANHPSPMTRMAPRAPERAPEADTAAPRESKFGPAFFEQLDRRSF